MRAIQKLGISIFVISLLVFIATLSMSDYKLTEDVLASTVSNKDHYEVLKPAVQDMIGKEYTSKFSFIADFQSRFDAVNDQFKSAEAWDKVIYTDYTFSIVKASSQGILIDYLGVWAIISFLLTCIGGLMYILPQINDGPPGIKNHNIFFHAAMTRGWIGIILGTFLIGFYVLLYWFPAYITNWVLMLDPVSMWLSGNPASQWFLYGFMYCLAMVVMGIRMAVKYRNNPYQLVRTGSVVFFQLAFAFLIPEILVKFNQPYFDFKNIWPLDYDFFFNYNLETLTSNGQLGLFMLGWGILLIIIGVPLMVYFFGKRWYCSWVCGCGGLAETLGDPFRQLSDKSVKAWKIERWMIHSVLVFAVFMTGLTLYTFFTESSTVIGFNTYDVQKTYGFLIGSVFSGVVGTGFYPLMGNRVWCRFGCPLAAYLGLVQRFKSKFRISTNGGQCISCGNCSTYCEMGIDVRWYAQRGQNIVRSSCVGCGICSAVCPRGVLKLENGPEQGRINESPILIGNDGLVMNINLNNEQN